jgi:predicted aspartyl protease
MRAFAFLVLLLAAAPLPARQPAPAPPASALSPNSAQAWVPFTLTRGNQIAFSMTLDGKIVRAVLDTGVSHSVLSRAYVTAANLRVQPGEDAMVIGGAVPVGWVKLRRLSLGGLTRTGGTIGVADLPPLATGGGAPIDLLVGPDLLDRYALEIDYDARRFRLLPSGRLPFRGVSAPLWVSGPYHLYMTTARLGGQMLRPIVVDTGDGSMVTLSDAAWRAAEPHPPRTTSMITYGIGGAVTTGLAIVPELAVGDLSAQHVQAAIEPPGGFSDAVGAAGRIGSGFLQRYHVLLDPGAGRIVFSPGADVDRIPTRSTSGLMLQADGHRLIVLHVMRGSPAADQGWRTGDLICTVDGAPIPDDYRDKDLAGWSTDTAGRRVTLGMCDGSRRLLTLANFY